MGEVRRASGGGGGGGADERPESTQATSFEIGPERWARAEEAAHKIICKVHPCIVSEQRRGQVIDYVQRLIKNYLGARVFPYGSVPLKTYLPDGDIDLTAFGGANTEDQFAEDMKSILEEEERNSTAEFVVKDVQLIRAEVKLVKCIVQNIVVDISFNQVGGLCTLCFLEQVDRLIGKDHLFKRSIILIKSWCYYESRVLGAHHGLISTYALETLVLYIFHLFHSTLNGPLAVLYKFLDYFSKFDWETYCISLNGPVRVSLLPSIIAETPEGSDGKLLLSHDFLRSCMDMFSVPSRPMDKTMQRGFQQKSLNIVDPLKENNNLGRSVSRGNFYRIRSAFSYGARKLARILNQPEESIANELRNFFTNTLQRHGHGPRPDVQDLYSPFVVSSAPEVENASSENYARYSGDYRSDLHESSRLERFVGEDGVANDLPIHGIKQLHITNELPDTQSLAPKIFHAPHLYISNRKSHDVDMSNRNPDADKSKPNVVSKEERVARSSEEPSNTLSDLSGDYEGYFHGLQYGRWCYERSSEVPSSFSVPPHFLGPRPNKNSWNGIMYQSQLKQNGFSQHNGFIPVPAVYAVHHPTMLSGAPAYGWEEIPRPLGTGTYHPSTNQSPQPQGYIPSLRGRNQGMVFADNDQAVGPQVPVGPNVKLVSSDIQQSFSPRHDGPYNGGNGHLHANRLAYQPEGVAESGLVNVPVETSVTERSRQAPKPVTSSPPVSPDVQRPKPALSRNQARRSLKSSSYLLKDEDDFPPLSA